MRWPHSAHGQWPSAPFSPRTRPARDGSLMRDSSVPSTDTHIATSLRYSGGSPVLRILPARPSRRKISIERAVPWLHLTFGGSPARRVSVTVTSTPREASSIASVSPTGPAPTINTLVSNERSMAPFLEQLYIAE